MTLFKKSAKKAEYTSNAVTEFDRLPLKEDAIIFMAFCTAATIAYFWIKSYQGPYARTYYNTPVYRRDMDGDGIEDVLIKEYDDTREDEKGKLENYFSLYLINGKDIIPDSTRDGVWFKNAHAIYSFKVEYYYGWKFEVKDVLGGNPDIIVTSGIGEGHPSVIDTIYGKNAHIE